MVSIQSQLERYVSTLPNAFQEEFRRHRQLRSHKRPQISATARPYWKELPQWLKIRYTSSRTRPRLTREFFDDISWAQHSVFLFVRIQDDLFDGHAVSPALVYLADQFLLEADRVFSKHFARSSDFWTWYRDYLKKTTQSIIEVDALQRTLGSSIPRLETGYAGVNSIFKIGTAAICLKARRRDDMRLLFTFADTMAIIGQIIDDLRDFEEDLERKRFNYTAQFLLGRTKSALSRTAGLGPIGDNLVLTGEFTALFDKLRSHLKSAENMIKPLAFPEAASFIHHYRENVQRMENHLNNKQVEYLLSTLMK